MMSCSRLYLALNPLPLSNPTPTSLSGIQTEHYHSNAQKFLIFSQNLSKMFLYKSSYKKMSVLLYFPAVIFVTFKHFKMLMSTIGGIIKGGTNNEKIRRPNFLCIFFFWDVLTGWTNCCTLILRTMGAPLFARWVFLWKWAHCVG